MGNILIYMDRLLINPVLGASSVSIYFVSSVIGKMLSIVLGPISSVMLSYLSKTKEKDSKSVYFKILFMLLTTGTLMYIISIPVTPIIVSVIYPKSLLESMPYFNLSNMASILVVINSLLQPLVLVYCPIWWQVFIQAVYGLIYVCCGYFLMIHSGLFGFCIAVLIANLARFILLSITGYYYMVCNNKVKLLNERLKLN